MILRTMTVVEGEPFTLPKNARIVSTEPIHWSMDGKPRWRLVMILEDQDS